jgi:hypothetical protein
VLVRDPDGVILTYRSGHGFAVNPVATTGRWQGLNDAYPVEHLADALLQMAVMRDVGGREFVSWEYFDVLDRPGEIQPGVSGMAQARMADMLARAYRRTGEPRFADAARSALVALTVPVDDGGARSMVSAEGRLPGPWYVERAYPGEDPWKGAALNGFMVALLSLRAVAVSLDAGDQTHAGATAGRAGARLARSLADDGERTLRRYLALHDSGSWSYYGLLTPGRPWRTYLADLNYHCYHVTLLRRLDLLYPAAGFARVADRWVVYVSDRDETCPARPRPGERDAPPADPAAAVADPPLTG